MSEISRGEVIENEQTKRPFIVEIGPVKLYEKGITAEIWSEKTEKNIEGGALCLAVDSSKTNLDGYFENGVYNAVVGDMAKMFLLKEIVDEVWIINVFFDLEARPRLDGTGVYGFEHFFNKLSRVLKLGGGEKL